MKPNTAKQCGKECQRSPKHSMAFTQIPDVDTAGLDIKPENPENKAA